MDRERADKWLGRAILGVVSTVLSYGLLALGAVRPLDLIVFEWLTVLCLLLWLARCWVVARPKLLFTPLCWAVLFFLGYAIWRYCVADVEYVARQELVKILIYAAA